jgi:hypothetical protein
VVRGQGLGIILTTYLTPNLYGAHVGKKVLETIFVTCALVALLFGRKYGRLPGGTHGSLAPPHA